MRRVLFFLFAGTILLLSSVYGQASDLKILTNHVGYEATGPKHVVIQGTAEDKVSRCAVKMSGSDKEVFSGPAKDAGPVKKWKDWYYWTFDFDPVTAEGQYYLECASGSGPLRSYPFMIQKLLLERNTLSDAIYYFKEERSSGQMDKADHHLAFDGAPSKGFLDAHGGWWDATGDYGKHFSHLSFSTYFNPQQIPFVVYSLFKSHDQLKLRKIPETVRYQDRLLDEAMFGADYLVRMKAPNGSFYRSVTTGSVNQVPDERKVAGEMKKFGISTGGENPTGMVEQASNALEFEVSYRSGGGVAIAALAIASTYPISGEFKNADYLKAAEDAFAYLEKNNLKMVNDGKENILDDYCALTAATELYRATHKDIYKAAADRRARSLMSRLISSGGYQDYWRADDKDRPYFHAVEAGFPAVSLLYYAGIADPATRAQVYETVKKSLASELAITSEVSNPFGYGRQLVQDINGKRYTSFFFPHHTEASPWWQGENARLASLAAAARLAAPHYTDDPAFQKKLESFADDQLNWILGLNPYDSSMMYGVGRNNPQYMYFDSWEFTNAPGGISNGITSGFKDESDIDYDLRYQQTGADNDWRWQEQWLPHGAWYILAVSAGGEPGKAVTGPGAPSH
jgi:hypothetical protein